MNETYQIKKDGKVLFTGAEDECFHRLLRIQPFSTQYAMKYGGYAIEPESKEKKQEATRIAMVTERHSDGLLYEDTLYLRVLDLSTGKEVEDE